MRLFTNWMLACLAILGLVAPAVAQTAEQVVQGTITWNGSVSLLLRGQQRLVPTFQEAVYRSGDQVGTYQRRLDGNIAEGQLRDAVYAPLTPLEARQLDLASLPTAPVVAMFHGTEQRRAITVFTLQPLRRNPQTGQAEKLTSFSYAYTLSTDARRDIQARTYARASVLSTGEWFKIGVPASGLYKLDKTTLQALGLNAQSLDPARLRLFGNAMGTLPQANSTYRPDDLAENDIQFVGDANASLEDNEYFLFYARGPHTWRQDGNNQRFRHQLNPYTDTAYYFLNVGPTIGRRVAPAPVVNGVASARISTFTDRQFYERELINLLKSGRVWLGEEFTGGTQNSFSFPVTDLVPGSSAQVTSSVAAVSSSASVFQIAINSQSPTSQVVSGINNYPGSYPEIANTSLSTFSYTIPATAPTQLQVGLTYNGGSDPKALGRLDYLELNLQRQLRFSGGLLEFRSLQNIRANAISQFDLTNATNATVWDVTNPRKPAAITLNAGSFLARTDTLREFVAFMPSSAFPTPRGFGRVAAQNLHALNLDSKLDLVIVTHPTFLAQAEQLAAHRRQHDGLTAQVVTTTQVYNEFSSGGQDVTAIRDLMKMVYDRSGGSRQLYLLLFGDASYDYKSDPTNDKAQLPAWWSERLPAQGDRIAQNYVPVYESEESFDPVQGSRPGGLGVSYSSDDYFGLLDDNEGAWLPGSNSDALDIGIGRLPVRSPAGQYGNTEMASLVVNKLKTYDATASYGKWRNRLTFVADDGDYDLFTTQGAEPLANTVESTQPDYNVRKVYLDMYPQTNLSAGQRSPVAEKAIDESFEQGSLLITYVGHGGPSLWADEQILTSASVLRLQNANRLTFLFTGTCDFSTYDNPELTSAGELSLTDTEGGAVGLFTTTRVVYANNNQFLATEFLNDVLRRRPNGTMPRLGDIIRMAKNAAMAGDGNRNYALLGDPSMRLAYPEQQVVATEINGHAITASKIDTLAALSPVALRGEVRKNGQRNTSFTGKAQVTVYEKPAVVTTLGDDPRDKRLPISVRENIIYDGQATVTNGQFTANFVVPKDINYSLGLGKISLYAADESQRQDAHGSRLVPVGGASSSALLDTIPPDIRLFMDNEQFVFGGLTDTSTTLIAQLRDDSGINTAGSGIGHDLTATLDNDITKITILNTFYTSALNDFKSGQVKYLFKNLTPGPHVLHVKAWDTYNNSSEKNIEFIAASSSKLALKHVLNYPNPFSTATTFHFDHNRSGEELEIQVQIFTVSGRLVRTLQGSSLGASGAHISSISWDGRDEYHDQLARGVYIYRVSVRAQRDGATASKYEKLVILN
ncbi:Por secretion system C-terminal sorting domain-containing protein [Hymenobacter gelipurpurascens]|uniref:Por secretion system C-terminal sorting domain-containing protein n=1 Tax=Hymenobacter gelipurpurascens TaxID=89968 RepID=A0A212TRJ1_9BACT|nr:type IX secretion system sortase PorU [Hymenobacter gelipurpurascens]SNC68619.1 Por secretion system C-terminal sorting domain-containing protein [Hymenobacter gelipurpurascens]